MAVRSKAVVEVPDMKEALIELATISMNLRRATKNWFEVYGGQAAKANRVYWEQRMDEWIDEHIKPTE